MEADIPNWFILMNEKAEKYIMEEVLNCIYSTAHLSGHNLICCRRGSPICNALCFFPYTLLKYSLIYTVDMNSYLSLACSS